MTITSFLEPQLLQQAFAFSEEANKILDLVQLHQTQLLELIGKVEISSSDLHKNSIKNTVARMETLRKRVEAVFLQTKARSSKINEHGLAKQVQEKHIQLNGKQQTLDFNIMPKQDDLLDFTVGQKKETNKDDILDVLEIENKVENQPQVQKKQEKVEDLLDF